MTTPNVLADGVLCTFATTGTGTITLGNAVTGYFDPTGAQITTGSRVSYCLVDSLTAPTAREYGEGVLSFGAAWTLTRPTIRRSLSGGLAGSAAVNWSGGTKYVFLTPLAADLSLTGLGMSAFGTTLTDTADAAAARTLLSVQPTASPAFTTTMNLTRAGTGVLQSWSDTVAPITAQIGSDGASIYAGTSTNAPLRLMVNLTNVLYLDGRVMTGGLTAPAAGYSATGDITLPATGAVRALNTAKSWVSFTGSTGAIRGASFGVASVSRTGAGTYTITYNAGAHADANYCFVGMVQGSGSIAVVSGSGAPTATSLPIVTTQPGFSTADAAIVCVATFGS
jgi:hypothetical protein